MAACFNFESRRTTITHPNTTKPLSSYKDLASSTEKIPSERRKKVGEWKAGIYPKEIVEDAEDGYVKIHYKGCSTKYDEIVKEAELIEEDVRHNLKGSQPIISLGSLIKDYLIAGTRLDSVKRLRAPMGDEEFAYLEESLTVLKQTKTKTVYGVKFMAYFW